MRVQIWLMKMEPLAVLDSNDAGDIGGGQLDNPSHSRIFLIASGGG